MTTLIDVMEYSPDALKGAFAGYPSECLQLYLEHSGTREIGYRTEAQFIARLRADLQMYYPIYKRECEAQDYIVNPLLTQHLHGERDIESASGREAYRKNDSKNRGDSGEYSFAQDSRSEAGGQTSATAEGGYSNKMSHGGEKNDSSSGSGSFFTDAPQSKADTRSILPDLTINTNYFNGGYATRKDNAATKGSGKSASANYGEASQASNSTSMSNDSRTETGGKIGGNATVQNGQAVQETHDIGGETGETEIRTQDYGYSGKSISQLILEWRATFFSANKNLMEHLERHLLAVYTSGDVL